MASTFEANAADEFTRCFLEPFGETVIRRIGGRDDRTEPVDAIVDFDERQVAKVAQDLGGLITSDRGQYIEEAGLLDVLASQETTPQDAWVVDGKAYRQLGEGRGKDGGSKTIVISRRATQIARESRLNRR
jgi:hypothetical protein